MNKRLMIVTGSANPELTNEIVGPAGVFLTECISKKFADGERYVQISKTVRGADVFVIQPTCNPVNEHLMELLIMVDALKRASAERITLVIPYFGYARQDRKAAGREPITSKLVANLINAAGADRVVLVDLHAEQIVGFFHEDIQVDHLYANSVHLEFIKSLQLENLAVVSPDVGGVKRARAFAKKLGDAPLAIIDKRRNPNEHNKAESLAVVGDVRGKNCLMVDDIIDTGNTIIKGAELLKKNGANKIYVCCTHPVLSNNAAARIQESCIEMLITTNSIPEDPANTCHKIERLSLAPLLANAIRRIHTDKSVSELFD